MIRHSFGGCRLRESLSTPRFLCLALVVLTLAQNSHARTSALMPNRRSMNALSNDVESVDELLSDVIHTPPHRKMLWQAHTPGGAPRDHASTKRALALARGGQSAWIKNRIVNESRTPYGSDFPNTIALCALLKLETPANVKEWIDFYKWNGVDKIFLQENDEVSIISEMLEPYIASGFVHHELHLGHVSMQQTLWYNDCAVKAREEGYSWVAFLDMDEFAVVLKDQKAVTTQGALKDVLLRRFRYNAAVSVQWLLFGSNEHKERPEGGQMRGYTRCNGFLSKQMKCIGNMYWLHPDNAFQSGAINHIHECSLLPGATAVLANGHPLRTFTPFNKNQRHYTYQGHLPEYMLEEESQLTDMHSIVMFHYVTRSLQEFVKRKATLTGGGAYGTEFRNMSMNLEKESQVNLANMFAEFERRHNFDGHHDICEQGIAVAEAAGLS